MRQVVKRQSVLDLLERGCQKLLAPTTLAMIVCMYGFILWTGALSLPKVGCSRSGTLWVFYNTTNSSLIPVGTWRYPTSSSSEFYLLLLSTYWTLLAIFLDQKIRAEGVIRTIYLYPMAVSFVVTGTAPKWILNPGLGIEKMMRDFGFADFEFRWLVDQEMAIYTIVIAAVWQSSGFVMAMFLAGLRGVDESLVNRTN